MEDCTDTLPSSALDDGPLRQADESFAPAEGKKFLSFCSETISSTTFWQMKRLPRRAQSKTVEVIASPTMVRQ